MIQSLAAGLLLSTCVGLAGYWRGALSASGVLGAIITGTVVFGLGGFVWGALLVCFFLSSSFLSRFRARIKSQLADKFQKGSRRDLAQALANGAWAAALAAAFAVWHNQLLFVAFLGALATVTADTWATEIGVLSSQTPRLISTGRPVPTGTSGGVTLLGTITSLLGAGFIGAAAALLMVIAVLIPLIDGSEVWSDRPSMLTSLVLIATVSGLAGSLFDSLLGATMQAIYYCEYDQKETERRVHSCGRATRLLRGHRWLDNDLVNFLSSILGSGIAVLTWRYISVGL